MTPVTMQFYSGIFKRIIPAGPDDAHAVLSQYKYSELLLRMVVFNSHSLDYLVFRSTAEYEKHIASIAPEERCYHEVIFGAGRQRLKFDIDAESPTHDPEQIVEEIKMAIRVAYMNTYLDVIDDDTDLAEFRTANPAKFSCHIVINRTVSNHLQAAEFTRRVLALLPGEYHRYVDCGINKRIQNFRLVGNRKRPDAATKVFIRGCEACMYISHELPQDTLPDICTGEAEQRQEIDSHDAAEVGRLVAGITDHKYLGARNGVYMFRRIRPSYCDFCNRTHEHHDTVRVITKPLGNVINVYRACWHNKTGARQLLGSFVPSSPRNADLPAGAQGGWHERHLARIVAAPVPVTISAFDTIIPGPGVTSHVYSAEAMRPFELASTLCVRAQMKMGKTKALRDYIDANYADTPDPNIVFISFRHTFSANIKGKFPEFTLYSDVRGPLTDRKLIVQVESLHRVNMYPGVEPPDLLVLDECESIFEQFNSGLAGNFSGSFAVFRWLLRYSARVICMDANLSNRTYNILHKMRPAFRDAISAEPRGATLIYHHNTYKRAAGDTYLVTPDVNKWVCMLLASIDSDDKVAVPMSSLTEAKTVYELVRRKYPEKSIRLYSSETLMSEKRQHFGDVDNYWAQYDVLIYTPTVSAGVSFEAAHYDKVYGYFTDMSCPVETCLQMIGRIRNVRDRVHIVCLSTSGGAHPDTVESIRAAVQTSRDRLLDGYLGPIEYGENGNIILTGDYFTLWAENMVMKNLSRNRFAERFVGHLAESGAAVQYIDDSVLTDGAGITADDIGAMSAERSTCCGEVQEAISSAIATAPDLSQVEVGEILAKIESQEDISAEARFSYEKYKIRHDYSYTGDINAEFITNYKSQERRNIFRNLRQIKQYEDPDASLEAIRNSERERYIGNIESGYEFDARHRYMYDTHAYATGIIRAFGWERLGDKKYIPGVIVLENLTRGATSGQAPVCRLLANLYNAMGMPCHNIPGQVRQDTIGAVISAANKALLKVYGAKIRGYGEPPLYTLVESNLFSYSADDASRPQVLAKCATVRAGPGAGPGALLADQDTGPQLDI